MALREFKKKDVRYADAVTISLPLGLLLALFNIISGILISKKILGLKTSVFIGMVLVRWCFVLCDFIILEEK